MARSMIIVCLGLAIGAMGCGEDVGLPISGTTLGLTLRGVEPLGGGAHYEGWAIINGQPVSTGKFNVDGDGAMWDLDGNAIDGQFDVGRELANASAIVLTIEPSGDVDAIPADTHYLAGSMINGGADLSVAHGAALGDDFLTAMGVYILATPTNGADSDENSGIWFLTPGSDLTAGLALPTLPTGWEYEGWVVIDGTPVTTGRFTSADGGTTPIRTAVLRADLRSPARTSS